MLKDFTQQEKNVAICLDDLGLRYETQVQFEPYRVDFFIPELNLVIEADGVYGHLKKADQKRDIELIKHYKVKVFHIKEGTLTGINRELSEYLWAE